MDPRFSEFSDSMNGIRFSDDTVLAGFNLSPNLDNGLLDDEIVNLSFMDFPPLTTSSELNAFAPSSSVSSVTADSPDDHDSDPVLKYLNQILLEENMEDKPSMFHDPLALQAAEKSFYEVLGERYPPLPYHPTLNQNVANNSVICLSKDGTNTSSSGSNSTENQWAFDPGEDRSSGGQSNRLSESDHSAPRIRSKVSFGSVNRFGGIINGPNDSSLVNPLAPNIFTDNESILQFKRGMEEASKFLPTVTQLNIDLDQYTLPGRSEEVASDIVVKVEDGEKDDSHSSSRGRKHHYREDGNLEEERSNKQSAVYVDEVELSEMFDGLLLCTDVKRETACGNGDALPREADNAFHQNGEKHGLSCKKNRFKGTGSEDEVIDLRTLLISCAQSVATDDRRTAYEQLKQIRQHASASGDASQRVAHFFANGLEARLAGTGTQLYAALASERISAVRKLKACQVYLSACPFQKIAIFFANKMLFCESSETSTLHIVDFGILYGFQWPLLIQYLSARPGCPPKLRITGIELPQPGFRPAERVEETGRRLAKYCERFNVPFEYHAIATQKWETIRIEDLQIRSGEVIAVNCLFRFGNLLDESVTVDSPRDSVLRLIRKMNPDIFVHAIINGSYGVPFFVTRFREALFHYSAVFDMFDNTLPRENQERIDFEEEFCGREVMNIVACEGSERVERPETYKQWQYRISRAGFKSLPLEEDLLKKLRGKVKASYHNDFVFAEDGDWMLQGWKGRIICASSCWEPA